MDDQELCAALAARRPDAFEELVTLYGGKLIGIAMANVRKQEAAEDVVFGLIARWWERPPTIDPAGLHAFLARSVRNAVIDYIRRERGALAQPPRSGAPKPDGRKREVAPAISGESDAERYDVMRAALEMLRLRDRDVLEMYYERRNMTPADAAGELGMTVGAYRKAVHDAKVRLREAMDTVRETRHGGLGSRVS